MQLPSLILDKPTVGLTYASGVAISEVNTNVYSDISAHLLWMSCQVLSLLPCHNQLTSALPGLFSCPGCFGDDQSAERYLDCVGPHN